MPSNNPILNRPYEEPNAHYATNVAGELDCERAVSGRRPFFPDIQTVSTSRIALSLAKQVLMTARFTYLAALSAKTKAEKTLHIEIDEEAFERPYGHVSHAYPIRSGQQVGGRAISQFGEDTTKVLQV